MQVLNARAVTTTHVDTASVSQIPKFPLSSHEVAVAEQSK